MVKKEPSDKEYAEQLAVTTNPAYNSDNNQAGNWSEAKSTKHLFINYKY